MNIWKKYDQYVKNSKHCYFRAKKKLYIKNDWILSIFLAVQSTQIFGIFFSDLMDFWRDENKKEVGEKWNWCNCNTIAWREHTIRTSTAQPAAISQFQCTLSFLINGCASFMGHLLHVYARLVRPTFILVSRSMKTVNRFCVNLTQTFQLFFSHVFLQMLFFEPTFRQHCYHWWLIQLQQGLMDNFSLK